MNPTRAAVRAGVQRGLTELRNSFTNAQDLWGYVFPTLILLVTIFFMRGATVPGTGFSSAPARCPASSAWGWRSAA